MKPSRSLLRDDSGLSAVEFALLAPVLAFALVASVDLGRAQYERMTIDHAVRAGAQRATADPGQTAILATTSATASKNFTVSASSTVSATALTLDVQRFCTCPESTGVSVACTATCAAAAPTFIFYRISGAKKYSGMILPTISIGAAAQVQVR